MQFNPDDSNSDQEQLLYTGYRQQKQQNTISRPQLNFFQQSFEQTPQQHVQEDPNNRLKKIHNEYMRNQAFGNFKKSDATLLSNVEKGVTVKIVKQKQNVNAEQKQNVNFEVHPHVKKKRTVQFDLNHNIIHPIQKSEHEYLTFEEKLILSKRIRLHLQQIRIDSSSEENMDEESEDSYVEVVARPQQTRGILRKQPQQFKDNKQSITIEEVSFKQNQNHKNVSQKDKRVLEKRVEEHDYGVGLKLLQKQGFKYGEGLGANKQGILEPVMAVKKQAFTGEGVAEYEYFTEQEFQQKESQQPFFESKKLNKFEKQWKKNRHKEQSNQEAIFNKREEVLILDRNHIMDNLVKNNQNSQNSYKIIDMTNSGADYLTKNNQSDISVSNKVVRDYLSKVQQMTWSVQNLLEKKLSKYENNEQNITREKDKIITLDYEKQEEIKSLNEQNESIKKKEQFLKYLNFSQDDDIQISDETFPYLAKYEECFRKFIDQFIQFNLIALLVKKGEEDVKNRTKTWIGPLSKTDLLSEEFNLIKRIIDIAKDVFIQKKSQNLSKYAEELDVFIVNNQMSTTDLNILKRYIGILIAPILIKLRVFISQKFEPTQENCLQEFLEQWNSNIFSVETEESMGTSQIQLFDSQVQSDIMTVVAPKIRKRVSEWNLQDSLHEWLLPWMRMKNSELQEEVEIKLKSFKFTEKEDFGYQILKPWQNCLGEKWNIIILKQVIPKMLFSLNCLEINPQAQNIQPLKAIMKWIDDIEQYIEMIFSILMEKLSFTFEIWIKAQGDTLEMLKWLEGWERFLQNKVLNKVYKFQTQFISMKKKLQDV